MGDRKEKLVFAAQFVCVGAMAYLSLEAPLAAIVFGVYLWLDDIEQDIRHAKEGVVMGMRDESSTCAPAPTWQPIESAPKDGTEVLLYGTWPHGETGAPRRAIGKWQWGKWTVLATTFTPTHWLPIPRDPIADTRHAAFLWSVERMERLVADK